MTSPESVQRAFDRLAQLLPQFAQHSEDHDKADTFVSENYAAMKASRLMALAVPAELGGDGLALRDLAKVIRSITPSCASTALAFSMHTQATASLAWHWRHHKAPVGSILRRIAREQLALATSNGSDWLDSSGVARRTKNGFQIDAKKRIVSGGQSSDLLATSAIYDDPIAGPTVLHFMMSMTAPEVTIDPCWQAMGMRGTGSDQVHIKGLVISDRMIIVRRPPGKWHPLYHAAVMIATPLIFSVYLGIAEAARTAAIEAAKARRVTTSMFEHVGTMDGHLNTARVAVEDMLSETTNAPNIHSTNRILTDRTLAGEAAIATVEVALELAGGAAFMRSHPLERMFRDVQAARFHPLNSRAQKALAGRIAFGLDIDTV